MGISYLVIAKSESNLIRKNFALEDSSISFVSEIKKLITKVAFVGSKIPYFLIYVDCSVVDIGMKVI